MAKITFYYTYKYFFIFGEIVLFMAKIALAIFLISVFLLSGCTESASKQAVTEACIQICKDALDVNMNLSSGPCLANPISAHSEWVCDVAHSPRQDVDNNPENQCSAYRSGDARHFVELDENCNFIKSV
jgi:hypothetical protein